MELKQSFSRYGYNFELYASELIGTNDHGLKRYRAIYVAKEDNKPVNIEVVVLREMLPNKFVGHDNNWLSYPCTSDWGTFAWTYTSLPLAVKKYRKIPSIFA